MSRRRDVRRYGRGPYVLALRREPERWGKGFPLDVPAVAQVERLRLGDAPVTLLAGDNGSGEVDPRRGDRGGYGLRGPGR